MGDGSDDLFGELPSSDCQALKKTEKAVCEKRGNDGRCLDTGDNEFVNHYCFVLPNEQNTLGTIHFYNKQGRPIQLQIVNQIVGTI